MTVNEPAQAAPAAEETPAPPSPPLPPEPSLPYEPELSSGPPLPPEPSAPPEPELSSGPPLPPAPPLSPEPPLPSEAPLSPEPVKKDRRRLRVVLRWAAAVAVFAVAGSGTAYGITLLDRTDVPGLATHSDGRWDYPALVKPPLPAGSPGPNDDARNRAGAHYADLRKLVLPAPSGATVDPALKGTDGWLATKTFLQEFAHPADRREVGQKLTDNGLRHIAARGWTTPDGTHTRVYLLQFDTASIAEHMLSTEFTGYETPKYPVRGGDAYERDLGFPVAAHLDRVHTAPIRESKPYGAEEVREAYLAAGDTLALVVQSRKGSAPAVPFQQTVTLQGELLS
ncbi:hypothetical protein ABZ619_30080 [Streptomyces sp. NPDC007851]|uniref:hypothetical protein n=1 Tax=Streptomyces sp. NPDC007851 TaxID=3155008 RepID=UPI0033EE4587